MIPTSTQWREGRYSCSTISNLFSLFFLILLSSYSTNVFGQGETCATAEIIAPGIFTADGPSSGDGYLVGCFPSPATPQADWYQFTPEISGLATVSSCFGGVDTRLSIFSGTSCEDLTCVASSDDSCPISEGGSNFASTQEFGVSGGQTYYIQWDNRWSPNGFDWSLEIENNDLRCNAIPLSCGSSVDGSTVGATFDEVAICGTSNTAPGVWYKFTSSTDTYVEFSTCNAANYDTKISVFRSESCTSGLVCIGGNDDGIGCLAFSSLVSNLVAQAGEEYYILIHGFQSQVGTFTLTTTCTPLPECTSAPIVDYYPVLASNGEQAGPCIPEGEFFNTYISISATDDNTSYLISLPGVAPYVQEGGDVVIWGPTGADTPVVLHYQGVQNPGCNGILSYTLNTCPTNDECADALPIPVDGAPLNANNIEALGSPDISIDCGFGDDNVASGDVWFSFIAPSSGVITVETFAGTMTDSQLQVLDACGGAVIACDEDGGNSLMSKISLSCDEYIPGNTYLVQVDGWNNSSGTFSISVTTEPCPPVFTDVTLCVDLSCFQSVTAPSIAGFFNGWNAGANPLTDNDGDGIYCTTLQLTPGDQEFKFFFQEEGFEEFSEILACTVLNDVFINRVITVGDTPLSETYGWESCDEACVSAPLASITFCADLSCLPSITAPGVFGSFPNDFFNPNTNPLSDPDEDGIYCATVQLPAGNYEYLFLENGEPESFSPGDPCTVTCCGGQFTNRTLIVEDGVDQQITFGWESCDETCTFSYDCPDLEGDFGDACDDGNPNTIDDIVRDNCTCAGNPVNDECVDAIDIVCGESYFGSTTYANPTVGQPFCNILLPSESNGGVWYQFTPDQDGTVLFQLVNSSFVNSTIYLYSGSCIELNCDLAGYAGINVNDGVEAELSAGNAYYLYVTGVNDSKGDFELSVTCLDAPANDLCENAIDISCGGNYIGSTIGSTSVDDQAFCGGTVTPVDPLSGGVWYQYTPTEDRNVVFELANSDFNNQLFLYSGICTDLVCIDGDNDGPGGDESSDAQISADLSAFVTYYIYVTGVFSERGNFELLVNCACPALSLNVGDACDDGKDFTENDVVGEDCQCAGTPVNDECDGNPTVLSVNAPGDCAGNETLGTTIGANSSPGSDCESDSPDVYYTFNSGDYQNVIINLNTISATDLVISVLEETCGATAIVQCSIGLNQAINVDVNPESNYLVRIHTFTNFGAVQGDFEICIEGVAPDFATLNGSINGWNSNCLERDAEVSLSELTLGYFYSTIVTLNPDGTFELTGLDILPGTYDILVKAEGALAKLTEDVVINAGSNSFASGSVILGDLNGNNVVNIADYSVMNAAFGSANGDANFNFIADLNCNSVVNITDLSILGAAFGLAGDAIIIVD